MLTTIACWVRVGSRPGCWARRGIETSEVAIRTVVARDRRVFGVVLVAGVSRVKGSVSTDWCGEMITANYETSEDIR